MKKSGGLTEAPAWSQDQLEADLLRAIENFRIERTKEPLERYLSEFEACEETISSLLKTTNDLVRLRENAVDALSDKQGLEAVRYLASPPISKDEKNRVADIGGGNRGWGGWGLGNAAGCVGLGDLLPLAILLGVTYGVAWLAIELLIPAVFLAVYYVVLKAIGRIVNGEHRCQGRLPRALGWGALWATVYTLPLGLLVWIVGLATS